MGQLQPADFGKLRLLVSQAYTTTEDLEAVSVAALNAALNTFAELPATVPAIALRVAAWANDNWLVEALIRTAMEDRPRVQTVQTYGAELLRHLSATVNAAFYRPPMDPHETCFVSAQLPFISRKPLRDFLRRIADPTGAAVLIVNGHSRGGKTYSFQLFESVRRALQQEVGFALVRVDLDDEVPSSYQPEDLTKTIARMLDWNLTSMPQRPSSRYPKELAQWIAGKSTQAKTNAVLLLDGFNRKELDPDTRELVLQLVRLASAGGASYLRLVLLNFPEDAIPADVQAFVKNEVVSVLTTAEVTEFFATLYEHKGRVPEPDVIDRIVREINQNVTAPLPDYNEQVNGLVKAAAEKLN